MADPLGADERCGMPPPNGTIELMTCQVSIAAETGPDRLGDAATHARTVADSGI